MLELGAVLDPRLKFSLLEHCYNVVYPSGCQLKLDVVKKTLFQLYNVYANNSTTASSSSSQGNPNLPNIPVPGGSGPSARKTVSFKVSLIFVFSLNFITFLLLFC